MMTAAQCRGARAMLGWSRERLAEAAMISVRTIVDFERDAREPRHATLDVLQRAFEAAGVEFTNGGEPGVKLKRRISPDELQDLKGPGHDLGDAEAG